MHDVNGAELKKGDRVLVEFEVTELYPGNDACNVSLTAVHAQAGSGYRPFLTLNTKQIGVRMRAEQPRWCKHCPFAEHLHSPETNDANGCPGFEADATKA